MKHKIYSNKLLSVLLGAVVCMLWGSLYSCIKTGYEFFEIDSASIPSIMLFAGLRFFVSGAIMVLGVSISEKKYTFPFKARNTAIFVISVALTTIVIHYSLQYIAISWITDASKSSVLKQIGYLFISCFAFLFNKSDKFSVRKVIAGVLGFVGIIVVNMNGGFTLDFGWGEVMVILASFMSVAGNVISKKAYQKLSPPFLVAHSQFVGGAILTIAGILMGGRFGCISLNGILLFAYILFASIVSYLLWNQLVKYNDISKMATIKYLEPVFGVLIGGVMRHEDILKLNYLLAFVVIILAILVSNVSFKRKTA